MYGALFFAATAAVGVDWGYRELRDGGVEYIIQIEPHVWEELVKSGGEVVSEVPSSLRSVRRYRITVGSRRLPRGGLAAADNPVQQLARGVRVDSRSLASGGSEHVIELDDEAMKRMRQRLDLVDDVRNARRFSIRFRRADVTKPLISATMPTPNSSSTPTPSSSTTATPIRTAIPPSDPTATLAPDAFPITSQSSEPAPLGEPFEAPIPSRIPQSDPPSLAGKPETLSKELTPRVASPFPVDSDPFPPEDERQTLPLEMEADRDREPLHERFANEPFVFPAIERKESNDPIPTVETPELAPEPRVDWPSFDAPSANLARHVEPANDFPKQAAFGDDSMFPAPASFPNVKQNPAPDPAENFTWPDDAALGSERMDRPPQSFVPEESLAEAEVGTSQLLADSVPLDPGPLASADPPLRESSNFQHSVANADQAEPPLGELDDDWGKQPWLALTVSLMVMFASLGGNAYYGWTHWRLRRQYASLLAMFRQPRVGSGS